MNFVKLRWEKFHRNFYELSITNRQLFNDYLEAFAIN